MRVLNLVKTTTLASAFLILLLPYLINPFPSLINADYASLGRGSSMTPTIQDGDLVAVKAGGLSDIEAGDVLAVRVGESIVVHRLVDIIVGETTLIRLKGDGNERPDSRLYEESQIMGRVVAVYPLNGLYTSYGYATSLTAAALLAVSLWRRTEIDLNDVLLCLIIALSLGGIIGYRLIGGVSQ